jgi:hypothetical protein
VEIMCRKWCGNGRHRRKSEGEFVFWYLVCVQLRCAGSDGSERWLLHGKHNEVLPARCMSSTSHSTPRLPLQTPKPTSCNSNVPHHHRLPRPLNRKARFGAGHKRLYRVFPSPGANERRLSLLAREKHKRCRPRANQQVRCEGRVA